MNLFKSYNMKKFEHLFSQDPIGAFEKIEEDYTRYFEVSYKISNTEIAEFNLQMQQNSD